MKRIKRYYLLMRGFVRCRIFIFCPKCNSDAPEKQNCEICLDFYGSPDGQKRDLWWFKFKLLVKKKEVTNG